MRDGAFGGGLRLAQQVRAALYLPQQQYAVGVLGPQFRVGAGDRFVFGRAAQELDGVDEVLHHAVAAELAGQ